MSQPNWESLRTEMGDNVVVQVPLDEIRRDHRAMLADAVDVAYDEDMTAAAWEEPETLVARAAFDETKIRRYEKGTKRSGKVSGGRFAPKGKPAGGTGKGETQKKADRDTADVLVIHDQALYRQTLAKKDEPDQGEFKWPDATPEGAKAIELGDASDLQGKWTDKSGKYLPERLALHDEIIGYWIARSGAVKQDNPVTLFMAGGSGAGKTSVLGQHEEGGSFSGGVLTDTPPNAVYINPDDIKAQLPEYQTLIDMGDPAAASIAHEESSDIAKKLLQVVNDRGYNVVVDGTGDSGKGKFLEKIEAARIGGRTARVVLVDISTEEAVSRAIERGKRTGRMVPEKEIRKVHKAVSENFEVWQTEVDDWELYNNEAGPKLVAARKPRKRA